MQTQYGPYLCFDEYVCRRTINDTDYIVGIAAAYNIFGLIASEKNGIFVLDDTNKRVILDEDTRQAFGYQGPSDAQEARLHEIMGMDPPDFSALILYHPRSRLKEG